MNKIECIREFRECFTVGKSYEVKVNHYWGGVTVKDDDEDLYYICNADLDKYFCSKDSCKDCDNSTCDHYHEPVNNSIHMRIKYFDGATKLKKISKGNWIDVYANKDMIIYEGERAMIPLGFALELPEGYEGHLAPRSSTFKSWGIIQTNSVGVVDDSYIGDNDEWHMPVYCLEGKDATEDGLIFTEIKKGDKIGQFRIIEVMPEITLEEVDSFGNADRGGFGSTGER